MDPSKKNGVDLNIPVVVDKIPRKETRYHLMALVTFLSLSVIFFFPILFHPYSILFGGYGDCQATIAGMWAKINGHINGASISLYSAPFGIPNINGGVQPLFEWLTATFAKWGGGEISGYNILVFLSLPVTAFSTYVFLYCYVKDHFAAFVGGTLFGFCPAAVLHASAGHLTYSINFMLPVFLSAIFYHWGHHRFSSSLFIGLSYSVLTLLSIYWGYFALFLGIYLFVVDVVYLRKNFTKTMTSYLPGVLMAGLVLGVVLFPHIHSQLTADPRILAESGRIRRFIELATLSARPWDYILPPATHPLWGRWSNPLALRLVHGSNIIEQTLYLGLVPIFLLFVGVRLARNKSFSEERHKLFLVFIGGSVVMLILSAPPYVPIGPIKVPLPSYLLYPIFPMFRAYARSGIFVNLLLSCAAAVVLSQIKFIYPFLKKKVALLFIWSFLIFDYWSISPDLFASVAPPGVYQWLKNQPGDFIVAEYPMIPYNEAAYYQYPFWQRIHGKRMVNGALPQCREAWKIYNAIQDFSRPGVVEILRNCGVKYVIVHPLLYKEGPIPSPIKRFFPAHFSQARYGDGHPPNTKSLGEPIGVFGRDTVYRLFS